MGCVFECENDASSMGGRRTKVPKRKRNSAQLGAWKTRAFSSAGSACQTRAGPYDPIVRDRVAYAESVRRAGKYIRIYNSGAYNIYIYVYIYIYQEKNILQRRIRRFARVSSTFFVIFVMPRSLSRIPLRLSPAQKLTTLLRKSALHASAVMCGW